MTERPELPSGTPARSERRTPTPHRLGPVDLLVIVTLGAAAVATRWSFPVDGWFYDDAWQALAARAPVADLPVVGQTQPGFTALTMIWTRLVDAEVALVAPALVAGVLGPPALFVWLRRLEFGLPTSALLGAALVMAPIHIRFSGRVKVYTAELVVVVALASVLPRLVAHRWRPPTVLAWVAATALFAVFSSFSLLAAAAAGIVVLLHPAGDLRLRFVAVATQAMVSLLVVRWTQSTYDAPAVAEQWQISGGMLEGSLRTLPARVAEHLHHVVQTYPGGPRWLTLGLLAVGGAGLVLAAIRGTRTITARFLLVAPLLAMGGSVLGRIPFGPPSGDLQRVTIWLVPTVAFGLASAANLLHDRLPSDPLRRGLDVGLAVAAAALIVTGIGHREPYWGSGAKAASEVATAEVRADEVVWVTRLTSYSFALHSGQPYRIRATPEGLVGFVAEMDDDRLMLLGRATSTDALVASADGADRVTIVNAPVGRDNREVMRHLSVTLTMLGFELADRQVHGTTSVIVWERTG